MQNSWKTLSSKITYQNPYWRAREDAVIQPDGKESVYYIVEKRDFVTVIPLTNNQRETYLVKQFRYAVQKYSWELPMGGREDGEDVLTSAKRELREETGITAQAWEKLPQIFYTSNGFITEAGHIFIARDLTIDTPPAREGSEADMVMKKFSLKKVYEMIEKNEITDGATIIPFFYLQNYLKKL